MSSFLHQSADQAVVGRSPVLSLEVVIFSHRCDCALQYKVQCRESLPEMNSIQALRRTLSIVSRVSPNTRISNIPINSSIKCQLLATMARRDPSTSITRHCPFSTQSPPEKQSGQDGRSAIDEGNKTLSQRLKAFFQQYGKLGFIVYLGIGAGTLGPIYLALKAGIDIKELTSRLGIPDNDFLKNAGTFAIAYGIYKVLLPARLFITIALTSWIAKRTSFGRRLIRK